MISSICIAKNVYGGDGIGRLGDGRVVFVPGAFAGEQVKAEIVQEKKNFVKARLVEVEDASPDRLGTDPLPIPGMVYANLGYAAECRAKEGQLREFFDRARIPILGDLRRGESVAAPLNYRNKAVYHFARQEGDWAFGYRAEPSHRILDVTDDPLACPEINAKLPEIRRHVMTLLTSGATAVRKAIEREGNVTVRWTLRSGVQWWIGRPKQPVALKEVTCGRAFEVPADGFYQVNPVVGDELAKAVVAAYGRGKAVAPDVLDLYCGVGVFGLCCRPRRLTGIESGRQAVEFAKRNAAAQGYADARFFAEEVGRNLRRISISPETCVIVDPPRGGMEPGVPAWLAGSKAPRILCVSCDPATLVRDLKVLCRNYEVESVRWFDMFPRTARFETLVVLDRRKG